MHTIKELKNFYKFGNLVLLFQSKRFNNNLSNNKMKPSQHIGDFVQAIILPLDAIKHGSIKGLKLADIEEQACSKVCLYNQKNRGTCYVNNEINTGLKASYKLIKNPHLVQTQMLLKLALQQWLRLIMLGLRQAFFGVLLSLINLECLNAHFYVFINLIMTNSGAPLT